MQFAKWTAEGAANTGLPGKYTATQGMRQLPEICQYLAKRTNFVKQGGTAESYPSLTESFFCRDGFFCSRHSEGGPLCIHPWKK
jgi:hypothetical protein